MTAASDTVSALDLAAARRERSPWTDAWNQLIKNRLAVISGIGKKRLQLAAQVVRQRV